MQAASCSLPTAVLWVSDFIFYAAVLGHMPHVDPLAVSKWVSV